MNDILVTGGTPLSGAISVVGAKNAVLKQMVATLLAPGIHHLDNVPAIQDVALMGDVLRHVGAKCVRDGAILEIEVPDEPLPEAPIDLVRQMRASILVLGALLARCGEARVALPGGDDFGSRPIDMHLLGLREMGAEFDLSHGVLVARAPDGLHGADIYLDFPSVGATENILLGAVLANGSTTVENAAREPELEDLARFLIGMGARITGAGTSTIVVEGVDELRAADHKVVPDRLEAGTYLLAGAITGGTIRTSQCVPAHLRMELAKLKESGCEVETGDDWIEVKGPKRPTPVDFATLPYPGFHTDMHPQMVALLSLADGTSVITENIYESRFRYIGELNRMGADITTEGQHVVIKGVEGLSGCEVQAPDIRAGAALVVAALASHGRTLVTAANHIDRGYEDFVGRLRSVGAQIETSASSDN
ncbi:MAG: UDP-N-acetylglucosamine 1-carboxyvinyltransferase [Acidimicrobiia bacterium]|nr:UDP-N-acetylglucosamine 1-carboxyvinyltransferase [Acidimicrobiia bacterium]